MSVDLLRTVRLLHRVLGFLAQESPETLADIADGRRRLTTVEEERAAAPVPAQTVRTEDPDESESPDGRRTGATGRRTTRTAPAAPAGSDADFAEIADALRSQESTGDGETFLRGLRVRGRKPHKADLILIGRHLGLTLPRSATVEQMHRKLVERAIGARKKYAGLSKW